MSLEDIQSPSQVAGVVPEGPGEPSKEALETCELLMTGMENLPEVEAGRVIQGTVLKITESEVLVDIGQKSEGVISRSEFLGADGELTVKAGDKIEVQIESFDEADGAITVSRRKAAHRKVWETLEKAFEQQTNIQGKVVERTKGGLIVDVGVRAFLPGSQADTRQLRNLESLLGQEITCKIIKLNRGRDNLVVSRKAALEEELDRKRRELLEKLKEGSELSGRIKNITDYGAFVDLGGMDGLLHVTDLTWGRIAHASEVVQVGQEVNVKVLKYDPEKGRISLGMKQLQPDPWDRVAESYNPGQRLQGKVVSLTDYGAFVEVEPGVEGLIHVSEMAWGKRMKHPSKILNVNDRVDVVVLEIHPAQRRISLSLKQTLADPWTTVQDRYAVGMTVEGRVRNLTDFGAFVELEDGIDGLIHVSDLSWNRNVRHPSEVLKKGQKVAGVILNLDVANHRISLGLKQLQPDIWQQFFERVRVDDVVRGKVMRVAPFGAFVELEEGIEGLCHNSELEHDYTTGSTVKLEPGQTAMFRVLRLSPAEKRIGLGMRGVPQDMEEDEPSEPVAAGAAAAEPVAAASESAAEGGQAEPEPSATPQTE